MNYRAALYLWLINSLANASKCAVNRFFYHCSRLNGLPMFKVFGATRTTACFLAVIAAPNISTADIIYANGYLESIGNPGVYVQRWGTTSGTTPGYVSCGATTCRVGLSYRWRNTTNHPGYYWAYIGSQVISVPSGTLWDEAVSQWTNTFGRSGTFSSYWSSTTGQLLSTCLRASKSNGDLSPGQIPLPATCGAILPAPAKCEFNVQSITLNHQTIDKSSVNGHTVTSSLSTNCSTAANVIVNNVQGNAPIPVLPGITSTLEIDGRALGTQMQLPSGISNHTISSTLRDTGTAYGAFNTSVVLRITIL